MTETSCRRELELEIPAEKVQEAVERVARDFARLARIPGFRPGKAPATLVRRRFASDIKSEVLQSLIPDYLEGALNERKLMPVTRPQVDQVDFSESGPLKFRATFEVLPTFELGDYKDLEIELEPAEVTDEDVAKTLEEMRQRAASFVPVEGRAIQDGDYAALKILGTPAGGRGEPVRAENVLCHVGGEETFAAFTENLRGAQAGDSRRFEMRYPDDYPEGKLAGKTHTFAIDVLGIKEKRLPELNDDFAKDVSDASTLEELRGKIRAGVEEARDERQKELVRGKVIEELIRRHDFSVPEALVEHQMDVRLERAVRTLAAQGVDPRGVNVDWVALRRRQRERAGDDVRAELLLDRIAEAEKIEISEEELDRELARLAAKGNESATALRARLTKEEALASMKSKLRSDKTLDWLCQQTRIRTAAKAR
jgi:trigger factor